jgi:hypothetical protein
MKINVAVTQGSEQKPDGDKLSRTDADIFFVSPDGDDSAPGTQERPFATLKRATRAVRNRADRLTASKVLLRGGTYFLNEPLVLTPEDSGSFLAPIIYEAYPGERPILSAGVDRTRHL